MAPELRTWRPFGGWSSATGSWEATVWAEAAGLTSPRCRRKNFTLPTASVPGALLFMGPLASQPRRWWWRPS